MRQLPNFSAGPVEQAHAAVGANQAVFDGVFAGADVFPAGEIFAVEELAPVLGLGVGERVIGKSEQCENRGQRRRKLRVIELIVGLLFCWRVSY